MDKGVVTTYELGVGQRKVLMKMLTYNIRGLGGD